MIEMRVRDQHQIDRRKVSDPQAGLAQALQHKKPAGEIGIDDDIFAAYLQEKTGMAYEGHAHLPVGRQDRTVGFARPRRHHRVAHQVAELLGAAAQRRILERIFRHEDPGYRFSMLRQYFTNPLHWLDRYSPVISNL